MFYIKFRQVHKASFKDMSNEQFLKVGGTGVYFIVILYNLQIYYILILKIYETFHNKDEKTRKKG